MVRRLIFLAFAFVIIFPRVAWSQDRRPMDESVYDTWRQIQDARLSSDGHWILYSLTVADGDAVLEIKSRTGNTQYGVDRGVDAQFTRDSRFVVFTIKPADSLVKTARLEKKKPNEMPKDSLGVVNLRNGDVVKFERVKSFALAEDDSRWLAYHLLPTDSEEEAEGSGTEDADGEDSDDGEGSLLIVRNLAGGNELQFDDVSEYALADAGNRVAFARLGTAANRGVVVVDLAAGAETNILGGDGKYKQLAFSDDGEQLGFVSTRDNAEDDQPAFSLYHWQSNTPAAQRVVGGDAAGMIPGWWVSEHAEVSFSPNGTRLFFGTAPRPVPDPDEVPEWEEVVVDIWNWKDPLLQPMQLVQREDELKRTYRAVWHTGDRRFVQLADQLVPDVSVSDDGDGAVALGASGVPYQQRVSWDSPRYNDVYTIDVATGERRMVVEELQGTPRISPSGSYLYWWDGREVAWFTASTVDGVPRKVSGAVPHALQNELHDWPHIPDAYGSAGWLDDDRALLVYDKHDIWSLDPTGTTRPENITRGAGRSENMRFRYVALDREQLAIPTDEPLLLSAFDMESKQGGFYRGTVGNRRTPERLLMMDRRFGDPVKAKDADVVMFARQSFDEFPNYWVSSPSFDDAHQVSDANPQQEEYLWGSGELTEWTASDGRPHQGLLFKPEGFDESKKYPMMVYFYEKNSDNLHSHRAPIVGGSSISISYYVSRGYVVFIPDVHYRVGYPGESAFNSVVSGTLHVTSLGFVDEQRVGIQGHSWGGYQIAHLVTRTNIFAAAEAGAPVANMTSAYGGIRWGTGMSRMFQYEQTQSRIGGTLWNARPRYIENSPLFWADRIETPLLMMHNDEDTAVPWYQGIEFFVALRRLNKPVWLLNYNGEPHGLRKHQNRKDWALRMQQFFDHYLMDAPAPVWLEHGVPATRKGIDTGLQLITGSSSTGN